MATTPKNRDRRVQRTQHLLKQAFIEVVNEKGFPAVSIQDVTDRANVNRATFYAHFQDKYALLEAIISEKIQQTLSKTLPPVSQWDRSTLHLFIRLVFDCCESRDRSSYRPEKIGVQLEPATFERAAHEGIVTFLLEWLKQQGNIRPQVPLETIAHMMSWAILGAAMQRWQTSMTLSSDEMADAVILVMMEGVEQRVLTGIASE
jgi:AcrR family transcriptional regulator